MLFHLSGMAIWRKNILCHWALGQKSHFDVRLGQVRHCAIFRKLRGTEMKRCNVSIANLSYMQCRKIAEHSLLQQTNSSGITAKLHAALALSCAFQIQTLQLFSFRNNFLSAKSLSVISHVRSILFHTRPRRCHQQRNFQHSIDERYNGAQYCHEQHKIYRFLQQYHVGMKPQSHGQSKLFP